MFSGVRPSRSQWSGWFVLSSGHKGRLSLVSGTVPRSAQICTKQIKECPTSSDLPRCCVVIVSTLKLKGHWPQGAVELSGAIQKDVETEILATAPEYNCKSRCCYHKDHRRLRELLHSFILDHEEGHISCWADLLWVHLILIP